LGVPPLTDEQVRSAADLYKLHGTKDAAAKASGLPRSTFRSRLNVASSRGLLGFDPVLPGMAIRRTSTQTGPDGEVQRRWVEQGQERGEKFEIPEGQVLKEVSALVDPDQRVIVQWLKTKPDGSTPNLILALKEAFDTYKGRARPVPAPKRTDSHLLSVYPIADQHNGLLAWGQETGESYDLKIGAERLRSCMAKLVAQSPPSKQAIILNLGDWQHTDDQKNMTPRGGNLLDVDGRYFKVLTTGVQLMMDCIELGLTKHETMLVRNIPGNHDPHASIALTIALAAFYNKAPRVIIDDDPSDLFFHRFGSTLIGANHGHKMKAADMAMCMAVRRREDWGATKYHVFYCGHVHHEVAREIGDVRVESFQSLAAKDAYAASSGYNAGQSLTSITHHIRDGEIGRHRINIAPALARS
jgi:hypothetical protein